MKKLWIAAGVSLALVGYVVAQTIVAPQVSTVDPFNDLIQVIPNGQPSAQSKYAPAGLVTNVAGFYKSPAAPATGMTYTFGTDVSYASFINSGTLSTATVTMPANPSNGARVCVSFLNIVSTLTMSANTGQSINNGATAAVANVPICMLYSSSNATWDRSA